MLVLRMRLWPVLQFIHVPHLACHHQWNTFVVFANVVFVHIGYFLSFLRKALCLLTDCPLLYWNLFIGIMDTL